MEIAINKNHMNQKYQVNDISTATDEILVVGHIGAKSYSTI